MKICKHCGEENPDNKNWCKKCMKPLRDDPAEALPHSPEKEPSDKTAKSGIIRKVSDDSGKMNKSKDGFDDTKMEDHGCICGSMKPKNRSVSEDKIEKEESEQEGTSGLKGRIGRKEYGKGEGNNKIIRPKQCYCTRCSTPVDGADTLCPKCRNRKKKAKTICLRVVAVLLVVAMWSGIAVYFVGNRTPKVKNAEQAISVLKDMGKELGYENAFSELTEKNTTTIDGDTYYRLQQNYKGIPVYGKTVVYSADSAGNMSSITGNVQDINLNINLVPSITSEQAWESIRAYATEMLEEADTDISISESITCIYNGRKLAFDYTVTMSGNFYETYEVLVDAHNAGILEWNTYVVSFDTNQDILGAADVNCEFDDSHNLKLVDTQRSHSVHYFDLKAYQEYPMVEDVIDNSDFLATAVPNQTASGETHALANLAQIYDFYVDVLDRQSYNNQGAPVYLLSCDADLADLLADQGKAMACPEYGVIMLGAPMSLFSNHLGKAMDLVAHEYTHLVFQTEVGLSQDLDVTSVNEGIADIFGNLIELFVEGKQDPSWPLAEDAGYIKYNMADHVTMASYGNDAHNNASILSHCAYLMWNGIDGNTVKEIDIDALAKLWYRAMLMMPSDCNFVECRTLVELAASTMNLTDMQKQCVCEAFDAVGIPRASEEEYSGLVHLVTDGETAIKGTVYEVKTVDGIETVVPVPKATLTVYNEASSKVCKKLNMKNKDGFFETELPAGTYSVSITAEGYIGQTITVELDDNKVRYFSIAMKSAEEKTPTEVPTETLIKDNVLSGKCGDNLTWTLENGVLTISGTGTMYDYDLLTFRYAPWYEYREQITDLKIGSGVKNIGNAAFFECGNLRNVVIPGNVKCIGEDAFSWCGWILDKDLYHVTIEPGVERIESNAFCMGFPMESIDLPDSITYIGDAAFFCCYLKNITIPPNVTYMGGWLFEGDDYYEIEEIHFTGDVPEFAENTFIGVDVTAYYPANNKTWTLDILKDYGGNVTWIAEGKTDENEKALAAYRPMVEKYNVSSQEQNYGWYSGILIDLDNDNVQELVLRYLSAPFGNAWWSEHKLSVYDYENGKVITKLDGVTFGEIGGAGEDAYATILYKSGKPYVMTYNDFGETSSGGSMKPNRVGMMTIYDGKTCKEVGVYRIERWGNVMSYQIDQRTVSEKEFVSEIEQYQGVEVIGDLYQLIESPETFVTVSKLLQQMK